MKLLRVLKFAYNILRYSKLRSWLTIIGIVIGITAVVAIVSIGAGMEMAIEERFGGLGADIITVRPGFSRAQREFHGPRREPSGQVSITKNLTDTDVMVIKSIPGIKYVNGIVSGRGDLYYLTETASVSIQGVDTSVWKDMTTAELESGRYLSLGDTNVIVVGNRIAKDLFKQPLLINRQITIEGKVFRVVGILEESGGFGGEDNTVFMPVKTARTVIEDIAINQVSSISIKVADVAKANEIMEKIDKKLMVTRHVTEKTKDFSVSSPQAIQERIQEITGTMTLFLAAIAAVSLIVGAVGISNTMFTSVLEKTREIGIMKAIGARNRDVMLIFLMNSGLLGLVGGIIGVILGILVSKALPFLFAGVMAPGGEFVTVVSPQLIIFALAFSILIGMVSGAIPAYRASKLKPVEALRYE